MVGPPSSRGQELRWLGDRKDVRPWKRKQKFTKHGMQSKRKGEETREPGHQSWASTWQWQLRTQRKEKRWEAKVCYFKYGGHRGEETLNHTLILVKGKVRKRKPHFQDIWKGEKCRNIRGRVG